MFNVKKVKSALFIACLIMVSGAAWAGNSSTSMKDLVASKDFTFTNKAMVTVSLDLSERLAQSGQLNERAYVSIYSQYTMLEDGRFSPTEGARVTAGGMKKGLFKSRFTRFNGQSTFLIDITFSNGDDPIQLEQTVVANTLTD